MRTEALKAGAPSAPDLVVTKVWLDLHCDLHLTVKNQGGPIPESVRSAGSTKMLEVNIDDKPSTSCNADGVRL